MTPLMYRRGAKELFGLRGSTNLKNIPTNSLGEGIMEEWVLLVWILQINLFAIEHENKGQIPFLDTSVSRHSLQETNTHR